MQRQQNVCSAFQLRVLRWLSCYLYCKVSKALDVNGSNHIPDANVQQWSCVFEKTNRLFAALDNADGTFSLASISTDLASDAAQAYLDAYLPN